MIPNTTTKNIFRLTVVLFSLIGLISITVAKEENIVPKNPEFKKRDPALLISATTLMQKLKDGQRIAFVDVRTKETFEKFRIPGAINIPLHFIKTKAFLKMSPIVLINEGYRYSELEQEVLHLRDKGFNASILAGGLSAWKEKGGKIEGDPFAQAELNKLPPHAFYKEKDFDNWIIIDVSTVQTPFRALSRAIHVPLAPSQGSKELGKGGFSEKMLRRAVNRAVRERNLPFYSVLIVNESGEVNKDVKEIVKRSGIENVFYLAGGLKEYQVYLNRLALSWKSRKERVKSVGGCETCGKKVD